MKKIFITSLYDFKFAPDSFIEFMPWIATRDIARTHQTCNMELFAKIINNLKRLTIFEKSYILDI